LRRRDFPTVDLDALSGLSPWAIIAIVLLVLIAVFVIAWWMGWIASLMPKPTSVAIGATLQTR